MAKQPKSPKITMMAPVPMRTYGALVPVSEVRERYARLTFPDTPTAKRITPVNWKSTQTASDHLLNPKNSNCFLD